MQDRDLGTGIGRFCARAFRVIAGKDLFNRRQRGCERIVNVRRGGELRIGVIRQHGRTQRSWTVFPLAAQGFAVLFVVIKRRASGQREWVAPLHRPGDVRRPAASSAPVARGSPVAQRFDCDSPALFGMMLWKLKKTLMRSMV